MKFHRSAAVQERYKFRGSLRVPIASLQGIAERPLPCSYNVLQFVCALSRRKRGFESLRGRQFNSTTSTRFRENHLHRTDYRFSLLLPETASHRFPRLPSVTVTARGFSNTFAVGKRYRNRSPCCFYGSVTAEAAGSSPVV